MNKPRTTNVSRQRIEVKPQMNKPKKGKKQPPEAIVLDFTKEEIRALKAMGKKMDLKSMQVIRQALRLYQLHIEGALSVHQGISLYQLPKYLPLEQGE